ncbi:hypothetical protein FQR65_LT20129 [Abscondita terminalis]|nr:hypothetical protein FQR65_LT20129 [Abscondita terminalis]
MKALSRELTTSRPLNRPMPGRQSTGPPPSRRGWQFRTKAACERDDQASAPTAGAMPTVDSTDRSISRPGIISDRPAPPAQRCRGTQDADQIVARHKAGAGPLLQHERMTSAGIERRRASRPAPWPILRCSKINSPVVHPAGIPPLILPRVITSTRSQMRRSSSSLLDSRMALPSRRTASTAASKVSLDLTSTPTVGIDQHQHIRRVGQGAGHDDLRWFASPTGGTRSDRDRGGDGERMDGGLWPVAAARGERKPNRPSRRGIVIVVFLRDGLRQQQPFLVPVLGTQPTPSVQAAAYVSGGERFVLDWTVPLAKAAGHGEWSLGDAADGTLLALRPGPDSGCAILQADVREVAPRESLPLQHDRHCWGRRALGRIRDLRPPRSAGHCLDQSRPWAARRPAGQKCGARRATPSPFADLIRFLQMMGNEQKGDAAVLQVPYAAEQALDFVAVQLGRGFIQNDETRAMRQRALRFDQAWPPRRFRVAARYFVHVPPARCPARRAPAAQRVPGDQPASQGLLVDEEIFGDAQFLDDGRVLVHAGDMTAPGDAVGRRRRRLAVEADGAGVRPAQAGQQGDQRRLARAVAPEQGMRFAGHDRQAHVLKAVVAN